MPEPGVLPSSPSLVTASYSTLGGSLSPDSVPSSETGSSSRTLLTEVLEGFKHVDRRGFGTVLAHGEPYVYQIRTCLAVPGT